MGRAQLQRMAMFMIVLVVTLPMYTSSVFAQTSRVISISGEDDANGFRKGSDYTKIITEIVPAAGETFTTSSGRVRFLPSGYPRVFSNCEGGDGGAVRCTWTSTETWTSETLDGGEYQYEVCAKSTCGLCEGIAGCRQVTSIKVDEAPARVVSIEASPRATNGGIVNVAYRVSDTLGESASGCSGIGSLQIDYDGTTVHSEEIEGSDCTVSGIVEINTAEASNGNNSLCIFVADKLGQSDTSHEALEASCISIPKDDTEPAAVEFEIRDATGEAALGYTRPGGAQATVYAIVQTSSLFGPRDRVVHASLAGVAEDITLRCEPYDPPEEPETEIPSDARMGFSEEEPTTGPVPGLWKCKSPSFTIDLSDTATLELSLTILDEAGNSHTSAKTVDFRVDNDQPLIEEIRSQATVNGASYLGASNNTISVLITESSSGFASNNVYIQVGASPEEQAECTQLDEVTWLCEVSGVRAAGSSGSHVTISVTGADDSGQALTGSLSESMTIDKEVPKLMYVEVMNIGETNQGAPFFTTGDPILVRVHINDLSGMQSDVSETNEAKMDATRVSAIAELAPAAQCGVPEGGDHWVCEWQLSGLRAGQLELRFQLEDMLGNKGRLTEWAEEFHMTMMEGGERFRTIPDQTIEILESDEESGIFWELVLPLTPSPPRVDKTTAGLFTHTVWYELQLNPRMGGIKPASVFTDATLCSGDDVANYMDSAYVISPDPDGQTHHLKIRLNRVEFDTDYIEFDCQLEVITIKDGKVTAPQYINFTAGVPLFAEEDVSERLRDHIQGEIDGFIGDTEFIAVLNTIVKLLQGLCSIVSVLQGISDVLTSISTILFPCANNPFCQVAYEAVHTIEQVFTEITGSTAWEFIKDDFCGYITCRKTLWGFGDADDEGDYGTSWASSVNNDFSEALGGVGDVDGTPIFSGGTEQQRAERTTGGSLLGGGSLIPNPTNSLILSITTGCIPGIITNIQKLRNMRCKYLDCLINDVPAGMPVSSCSEVYSYSMCMWIWGELFNIIPGAQFVQQYQQQIFDSISSWSGIIGLVVGLTCTLLKSNQPIDTICRVITMPSRIVEIYQQVEAMFDTSYWGFDEADLCGAVISQWNEENAESDEDDDSGENRPTSSPSAPSSDGEPPVEGGEA